MAWPTTPVHPDVNDAHLPIEREFGTEVSQGAGGGGAAPPTTGQLWPRGVAS